MRVEAYLQMQMHNKKMFELNNEGQSDGAQHLQCHSKEDMNNNKNRNSNFCASSHHFRNINVSNV